MSDFVFFPHYSRFNHYLNAEAGTDSCYLLDLYKPGTSSFTLINYDLKNSFEELGSRHLSAYDLPLIGKYSLTPSSIDVISSKAKTGATFVIESRTNKSRYLEKVKTLQKHIARGDIYEINYCIEFFAENTIINSFDVFKKLASISEAPFSFFAKINGVHLLCASPERYLRKSGDHLISQPIKGTRKRSALPEEDAMLAKELFNDLKERTENIMIVDLVRNDLSRIAEKGTVNVDELCKIYSFRQVHQMISTISCTTSETKLENILEATFPMGSMTGAPKIRAMELIDEHEDFNRGPYSGSAGVLLPDGDFDLNVMIRSIYYDETKRYLSFAVGSAITASADPEKEYSECLLKAKAMFVALGCEDQWNRFTNE